MELKNKKPLIISLLILAGYSLYYIFFGEVIPVHDGVGFDGVTYASFITSNFSTFDNTNITRVIPPFIVYVFMGLFSISKTPEHIVMAFQVMNFISIAVSMIIWNAILEGKRYGGNWLIGMTTLFVSYSILKWPLFCPVMTDSLSFVLGTSLLYAYLKNKQWLVVVVFFLGIFTVPVLGIMALTVFNFPYSTKLETDYRHQGAKKLLAVIGALLFVYASARIMFGLPDQRGTCSGPVTLLMHNLSVLSLSAHFIVFSLGAYFMLRPVSLKITLLRIPIRLIITTIGLVVCFVLVILFINKNITSVKIGTPVRYINYVVNILETGARYPFANLIGHVLWLGPVTVLVFFNWKAICRFAYNQGLGMFLILVQFFIYSFDAESRHLITYMPFVCFCLYNGIDWKEKTDLLFTIFFAGMGLLYSRVLWNINKFPSKNALQNYNEYSALFFSDKDYIALAVFTIVTFGLFYFLQKRVINKSVDEILVN